MDETIIKMYHEGCTQEQIARAIKKAVPYVRSRLNHLKLPTVKIKQIKDITNNSYGGFTVLKFIGHDKNGCQLWKCKCKCGKIQSITKTNLVHKKPSCRTCGNKNRIHKSYKGYEDISGTYWAEVRSSAMKRKFEFELDIKDVWDLYIKQNRKCALSGQYIQFHKIHRHKDRTASIDRIDSNKGYTLDNIQIVHRDINYMKRDLVDGDFILQCIKVADFNRGQYGGEQNK